MENKNGKLWLLSGPSKIDFSKKCDVQIDQKSLKIRLKLWMATASKDSFLLQKFTTISVDKQFGVNIWGD